MSHIASFVTNPFAIVQGAFDMFTQCSNFAVSIMQQSMNFATSIMKLAV